MSLLEIKNKVNELAYAWEQFKGLNDINTKKEDGVRTDQIHRINQAIDTYQDTIEKLSAVIKRPQVETVTAHKMNHIALDCPHKKAMNQYLRSGDDYPLKNMETKFSSAMVDTDGGFFISRGAIDMVNSGISAYSPMRNISSVTNISGDALEIVEDFDEAYSGWVQETELRAETKTPTINKKVILVNELYAQPKATQKLIDDAYIDIEEWLAGKLIDAFTRMENVSFISGDGVGKPKGILSYDHGIGTNKVEQILTGRTGSFSADNIFKLFYSLKENFAIKGKFLMNRATVQLCRTLKDAVSGQYLWNYGLEGGEAQTLLGCPLVTVADMPAPNNSSLSVAFGDFEAGYQIVDRQGVSVLRDPFTEKPFVKFYATKRVGGGILNGNAIKLLKLA
jgi:HK97 family phage major capsid protein